MNEQTAISRLSVFIFGAMVFVIGIYHTFLSNLFWLSFILSASASFLSGIFLRKNTTPFKMKSLLYMSSMLVMFPVFNFYLRETPFKFCFIFPLVIYFMFLAGHSLNFKKKKIKSGIILILSLVFIAGSYFYIPYLLFHINEKNINKKINKLEILKSDGNIINKKDINDKVVLFFYNGDVYKLNEIAIHFKNNDGVLIYYVFEENELYHNLEEIKKTKLVTNFSFDVLFDKDNKFLKELNFDKKPGAFLVDKNMKIRKLYMNRYFFFGDYYPKKITLEINRLLNEI